MVSKIVLALCVMVAVASAVPAAPAAGGWGPGAWGPPGAGPWGAGVGGWLPPWVASAPWYPAWTPCTAVGSACVDCNTKMVCTKIGGMQRACTDPTLPYCNLGQCSATPTAECAPSPAVPTTV